MANATDGTAGKTNGSGKQESAPEQDGFKSFLVALATDPSRLGEFIRDPDATMTAAGIPDADQAILKSGNPAAIYGRLAGPAAAPPAAAAAPAAVLLVVDIARDEAGKEVGVIIRTAPAGLQAQGGFFPQFPQFPQQFPQIVPPQIVVHPQIFPQIFPQVHPQIFPQVHPQVVVHPQIFPQIHPQVVVHPQIFPQIHPQIVAPQIHPQIHPQLVVFPQIFPQIFPQFR
jgi:hypothetical protein